MTYRPYGQLTATGIADNRTNNTGVTIVKGTPVRINASGELDFVNVAIEDEAKNVAGVASQSILNGNKGSLVNSGKIENITTTASLGDIVFVDKTGALTNIPPSIGVNGFVSGDFIVAIGVIAKNESNASLKDLIINYHVRGQL